MINVQATTRRSSPFAEAIRAAGGWRSVLRRAFWSLGVLAHVPAIGRFFLTEASPGEHVGRALMLLVGLTFCILKVVDFAALRVKPGWRSTVICLVALALIHFGCLPGAGDLSDELCLVTTTGASAAAVIAYHISEHKPLFTESAAGDPLRRSTRPCDRWAERAFRPALILTGPLFAAPRAPPIA